MSSTIDVEELRVGMYIQLDGGWLSHPFALSNFRIANSEQISTLRGLGLARVRWVPERSEPASAGAGAGLEGRAAASAGAGCEPCDAAPEPAAPCAPDAPAADAAAVDRAQWLGAQQLAAQHCERQYGEAAASWREINDTIPAQPQPAGRSSEALAQAMLDKMLAAQDIDIRLIGGGSDRAAAHALNVAVISMLIGRTLGLAASEMLDLGVGALLHDVGKIDVDERYRHADESFDTSATHAYRDHVVKGVLQGRRMALSGGALLVLAQHHEHTDGSGFPQRVQGERMAIGARIVAIVNRYDNLCNPGSGALALTPHEAVATLFAQGRARYDGAVLNAFIRMMGVYPAGSLVQLTDDRYGMVVGVNSSRPLRPRVLVVGGAAERGAVAPAVATELIDLEGVADLGIRRSLQSSKLPAAALQALDPRPRVSYYFEARGHDRAAERAA